MAENKGVTGEWVIEVIIPISGVIILLITGRRPLCTRMVDVYGFHLGSLCFMERSWVIKMRGRKKCPKGLAPKRSSSTHQVLV